MTSPAGPNARANVDVYLFPAQVGGGYGDIEEVLTVGRRLGSEAYPIYLFRERGRDLPRGVDGPLRWPGVHRVREPAHHADRAVTISPSWGVCVAPRREGPYGRAGEWAEELRAIEGAYGPENTLQLSLEEFARTLTSREQTLERYREGGVPIRTTRRRLREGLLEREIREFHRAYGQYRGFAVPNLLHVYSTFSPSKAFQREFPNAVQVGPIIFPRVLPKDRTASSTPREWVVYAGPASADRMIPRLAASLAEVDPKARLVVRPGASTHHATLPPRPRDAGGHIGARDWVKRFSSADVRIVSGSRTLLEALQVGGPFLYFNGTIGEGRSTRRHRPEKLVALLEVWKRSGVSTVLLHDLSDFARLRGVESIVRRAVQNAGWRAAFSRGVPTRGFRSGFEQGEEVIADIVRAFPGRSASSLVAALRSGRSPAAVPLARPTSRRRARRFMR
ncbi:MAG: hypothetical protein L3J96_05740 [Thermoplasmata archaeon]|nr:hypothetical protein [Thermoplasmata archaeon]